jgi:hypothetical protein
MQVSSLSSLTTVNIVTPNSRCNNNRNDDVGRSRCPQCCWEERGPSAASSISHCTTVSWSQIVVHTSLLEASVNTGRSFACHICNDLISFYRLPMDVEGRDRGLLSGTIWVSAWMGNDKWSQATTEGLSAWVWKRNLPYPLECDI